MCAREKIVFVGGILLYNKKKPRGYFAAGQNIHLFSVSHTVNTAISAGFTPEMRAA